MAAQHRAWRPLRKRLTSPRRTHCATYAACRMTERQPRSSRLLFKFAAVQLLDRGTGIRGDGCPRRGTWLASANCPGGGIGTHVEDSKDTAGHEDTNSPAGKGEPTCRVLPATHIAGPSCPTACRVRDRGGWLTAHKAHADHGRLSSYNKAGKEARG